MIAARQLPVTATRQPFLLAGVACLALISAWLPLPIEAQANKPTDYDVKAAYLFNFGKFVRWPVSAPASDTFPICVLGSDPFGSVLDTTVAGESIDGRRIIIRRLGSANDALNCRIAFISTSESGHVREIMSVLGRAPVLTVSDIPNFVNHGVIQFVTVHDRVRFEVNLGAAERGGLTLSSELLKIATSVKREGRSAE